MDTEMRRLRAMLARREGGRGRRFAAELRRQITAVGRGLRTEGKTWFKIGREIGLPSELRSDPMGGELYLFVNAQRTAAPLSRRCRRLSRGSVDARVDLGPLRNRRKGD